MNDPTKVSCPSCGNRADAENRFCSVCGKALNAEPENEKVLLSFGPMDVSVCFKRPGFFVLTQRNDTKIVLTNKRIYGLSSFSGKPRFDVQYNAITSKENTKYNFFRVLYLQYRENKNAKEVSIMGGPTNYSNVARAYELIPAPG